LSAWAWLSGGAGTLPLSFALLGWAGLVAYTHWYSSFGGRHGSARIRSGAPLPHFTVTSVSGAPVTSAQLTDKPAVLIFFRGNWCPLCMAQVKELVGRYKELGELGVRVALIAPQPHANTQALAKRFDVPFEFLTDEAAAAARILGINHKNGLPMGMQVLGYESETVLPTVIITDGSGKVVWAHETDNYRVRPEPDTYLEILRKHGVLASPRV
jgi:peroxiredoxin